jgi:hypothetical protein
MQEFVIELDHRPGTLARLMEVLAEAGVNVDSLTATGLEDRGTARIIVDDERAARRALLSSGLRFSMHAALTATIPHRAGALAEVMRSLASADVNVEAVYVLRTGRDQVEMAIVVDDPEVAAPLLPVIGAAAAS